MMTEANSLNIWKKLRQHLIEWNLFRTDDIDDPDKQNTITSNSELLKEQRISTRVYIILLTILLLILIISTLLSWQTEVITIYNPTLQIYEQLQNEFSTTLNCPCNTTIMPYQNFIITNIIIHQICSSDFVSQAWIDVFYIPDSSRYTAMDFRTTANAQFKVLQTLCKLAHENIFDALSQLNNTQLLTASVLPKNAIFIRTKISSERIRTDTVIRFNNALKLIQLSTHSSRISTALNTNYVLGVILMGSGNSYGWSTSFTTWRWTVNNETTRCRCDQDTCSFPAGFYSFYDMGAFSIHSDMRPQMYNASDFVPGFVSSCTPLQAVLQGTFVCLYDKQCIMKLVDYFPRLTQLISTINTLNTSVSSKYPLNVNISHLVDDLFLEQWNVSINYERYYNQCAPKICTYSYKKRANFIYMITLLISLCGGLQTILRFCIPPVVQYLIKKRSNTSVTNQIGIGRRLIDFFRISKNFLMNFNLFESTKRSPEAIYRQRLSTKIYLCLLFGSLFILLLFTTVSEQTTSNTYENLSYIDYQELYIKYSDKLICPCTEITTIYSVFINITPVYHPVCSSAFVTKIWFDQLRLTKPVAINMLDWRILSHGYFEALATLCEFAYDTVNNGLQEFGKRTIVTMRLLDEESLRNEMNEILDKFIQSMEIEFKRVNNILRLLSQVNQYFTGASHNGFIKISNETKDENLNIHFLFHGPTYVYGKPKCICAFQPNCEESIVIIHNRTNIPVPGFVLRCSSMDAILQSTLECLYSNTSCLTDILLYYINYTGNAVSVPPLEVSQLIRTSTHSKVVELADNLFIEQWKSTISHRNYFRTCAPNICQYTYIRRANFLYIATVFLAVDGGLTFALRLLVPLVVKLAFRCRRQSDSTDNQNSSISCQRIFKQLQTKLIKLNLFPKYSFDENINEETAIRLGRLTTRFYVCLYIIGLIILALYTSIHQRTLTTKIENPSIAIAQELHARYVGTTECPCTKASIPIKEFVYIEPYFHQICTSTFVTNEWHDALTMNLDNMTYFARIGDYRPYFSVHLQFLSGLCQHAIQHVHDTIHLFTSTSFVTSRLFSKELFDIQISNLLNQIQTNIATAFTREIQLAQAINDDNKLLSIYQSNYQLVVHRDRTNTPTVLYTKPIIYNRSANCSCGRKSNCVTPAVFTWPDYVEVKGLFIGCLPSQSLLASTLECFYDINCIDLIRKHMNSDINQIYANPLNGSNQFESQYQINTTVNELVSKLFIENWSTKIFYNRYFDQCAPHICSYSYIDNANPLYVATILLGLYGGLTVVLSWWCPQFINMIRQLHIRYKKIQHPRVVPSIS